MEFNRDYFIKAGRRGGKKAAKGLGKDGLKDRAKRGWETRRLHGVKRAKP